MPRPNARDSDDSDDENALEAELEKLQLQYKISEQQRLQYSIEVQKKIRLQNQLINNLESEKDDLRKNLKLAESKTNEKKDNVRTEKLENLISEKDQRTAEIKEEKDKGNELEMKILEWEKKLRSTRRDVGGTNAGATFVAHSKKRERVLENRLDQALKNFNTLLTQNSELRDEIDSLRIERNRFEDLHNKLERELSNLRQEIAGIIENSTQAYDQREEAQTKMVLMREKEDKDKQQHYTELKEVVRVINHDKKLKEFMRIKTQERSEDEELLAWRKRKDSEAAEKRRKEKEEHSVEAYETKFKEIEQITGETDLNKLVERFIQAESKNYALFNFVNELNSQVETLQEQIDQIKFDMKQFEKQGIEMEEQRKNILKELEQKYKNACKLTLEYEEKTGENKKILDQCRLGIESLFKKINCDQSQIDMLLLSKEGVTESNMSQYLGIIDSRTDELLKWKSILEAKKDNLPYREKAPNYIGDGPIGKLNKPNVQLPSTGDGHDALNENELDDLSKPLTRAELQNRVLDGVRRKELDSTRETSYQNDLEKPKEKLAKTPKKR